MKYQILVTTTRIEAIHTIVIGFATEDAANMALSKINSAKSNGYYSQTALALY